MNDFENAVFRLASVTSEAEDYTGEDGLLYCGKCHTAKQFRMESGPMAGQPFPHRCQCEQERADHEDAAQKKRQHLDTVDRLKKQGFSDSAMREWTFENDNGKCPQMKNARFYVEHWENMKAENIGYLLWGGVGTGKSYLAGCIANALMEKEISVSMTNFAAILNDLMGSFSDRNGYIERLNRASLLILDDFGMERGTEYGLEQVYNIIDSRYRAHRPLIVTTNLSLDELQHPTDTPHARIYDRLLELCSPLCFTGANFRRQMAQAKMDRLKTMLKNEGKRISVAATENTETEGNAHA